jgi:CO dehydrogenase maturation factor
MEHMSRLVTTDVDHLFVVSDGTARGIMTAGRILDLVGELKLNIGSSHVVVNRVQAERADEVKRLVKERGLEIGGIVHDDSSLFALDAEGGSVFSLPQESRALSDAYDIFNKTT